MEEFLSFILKSAAISGIFILVYLLLLKNDTSFEMNRKFLLGGIFVSFILPFIEFTQVVLVENTILGGSFPIVERVMDIPVQQAATFDWWQIAGLIYFAGMAFLSIRFMLQLVSLWKIIKNQPKSKDGNLTFVATAKKAQPFSFFGYIVYNPDLHSPSELEMILEHEKIHARQWHSADVVLINMTAIFFWFNPFIWLYRKHLIQNLEFIADRATVATSVSKMAYQQALVKVSVANFQPALSNLFYQSLIKKRIIMLNKKSNQKSPFWKISLVIPFLIIFMFFFQVKTEAQVVSEDNISEISYEADTIELSAIITKNATKEDLETIKDLFKKQGVILNFDNLEFNSEGKLSSIKISFVRKAMDQKGNLHLSNPKGISSTTISLGKDSFSMGPTPKLSAEKIFDGQDFYQKIGENPLFIIAGKEYKTEELSGKNISVEGEFSVLTPAEAVEEYGNKGRDGVLIISEGKITKGFENAFEGMGSRRIVGNYIVVRKGQKPMFMTVDAHITKTKKKKQKNSKIIKREFSNAEFIEDNINASENGNNTSIRRFRQGKNSPLIVINGKIQKKDFDINSIEVNNIEAINVLKDENAVQKYGKKAKNGVIEITLKSKKEHIKTQNPGEAEKETKKDFTFTAKRIKVEDSEEKEVSFQLIGSEEKEVSFQLIGIENFGMEGSEALIVVNGKIQDKNFKFEEEINSEDIQTVNVLKGEVATKKYGQKATKGVIEIITKDHKKD